MLNHNMIHIMNLNVGVKLNKLNKIESLLLFKGISLILFKLWTIHQEVEAS